MLKAKDLRDQSIEELEAQVLDKKKELFQVRSDKKLANKTDKPHLFKEIKKDVAKILTVIREKQLAQS